MKHQIQKFLKTRLGYVIERYIPVSLNPLDVFDLVIRFAMDRTSDFIVVQIGANDGISHDPIRKYIEKWKWRGVLVEPNPVVFQKLLLNYKHQTQLSFENSAISLKDGESMLYMANIPGQDTSGQASFDLGQIHSEHGLHVAVDKIPVRTISAEHLLRRHGITEVSLLQVDTEGYDFEVLKLFDIARLRPTIIHFEHCHLKPSIRIECFNFLCNCGYRLSHSSMDTVGVFGQFLDE